MAWCLVKHRDNFTFYLATCLSIRSHTFHIILTILNGLNNNNNNNNNGDNYDEDKNNNDNNASNGKNNNSTLYIVHVYAKYTLCVCVCFRELEESRSNEGLIDRMID
jgi:hypothetical protein